MEFPPQGRVTSHHNLMHPTPGGKKGKKANGTRIIQECLWGFPCGSDGKESACSDGDPGLIPGLRRSPGEGNSGMFRDSLKCKPTDPTDH